MRQQVKTYLEKYGIRPSVQRLAVMEYLMEHKTHPGVEEIYSALSPLIPTLSKTTVYNTLGLLLQHKAILALDLDTGKVRYDGDTSSHAHFICTHCGKIEDIFFHDDHFTQLCAAYCPEGAAVENVQLIYKGICRECGNPITTNPNN